MRIATFVVALVAALLPAVSAPPASAADEIYPLVFPVVGDAYYSDTFGACRSGCSRTHQGNDLMTYGLKGVPIVAAHDGVVRRTSTSSGRECCAIWGIEADDGWETWYIHMNNDTPGTDDGLGWGFAPGIDVGAHVTAGQLIGWVGDSGNAESTGPHLHFELHRPDGVAISPYASLQAATHVDLPRIAGPDRFHTAAQIALDGFPGGADTVYVATGWKFPDALAVGAAAASLEAPVLLVDTDRIPGPTSDALLALGPSRIVIVGGPGVVGDGVARTLSSYAPVERYGGSDRFQTAVIVAESQFSAPATVYLANGYSYPDAVSAAVAAGATAGPLVLSLDDALPGTTQRYLESLADVTVVAVGNDTNLSQSVLDEVASIPSVRGVSRLSAPDASGISIAVSEATFTGGSGQAYLATSLDFPDALAGASLAGRNGAPVLLVDDAGVEAVAAEVARLGSTDVTVLGGPEAVPYRLIVPFWNQAVGNTMPTWNSHG